MSKTNLVAISGSATSGKDTLYLILEKLLTQYNITTDRIGLGDFVKAELNEFTKLTYGINIFTKNPTEKELIRPLMVIHGKIFRIKTFGTHYTSLAEPRLKENIKDNVLSIITDLRYFDDKYPNDEVPWVRNNNGIIVYIERINNDGSIIPPANSDEEENNQKIKRVADFRLRWPTTDDIGIREDCVKIQLKGLIEKICK